MLFLNFAVGLILMGVPDGSYVINPPYTTDPALTDQGKPAGRHFNFTMKLSDSKVFNGTEPTNIGPRSCEQAPFGECCDSSPRRCAIRSERLISVYIPHGYIDGQSSRILVMQDGPESPGDSPFGDKLHFDQLCYGMDNLIGASGSRSLPVFIAIAVQNGGGDAIKSERGLEYDTVSGRYAHFINTEVLPGVLRDRHIHAAYPKLQFSTDPDKRATFGCSSGASAALTMAWFRPDLFRRVIAYSVSVATVLVSCLLPTSWKHLLICPPLLFFCRQLW
jgi:enterochelin esterase-like enzyme